MPPGVVITMLAARVLAGVVAVIEVALLTVNEVPGVVPKVTAVAPVNPVPVMVTEVPPAVVPDVGETLVNDGAEAVYVYVPVAVPPGVVITMLAAPAVPAGVVAVIDVLLTTVNEVAAVPPKVTEVATGKSSPGDGPEVPPAVVPDVGKMLLNVGAADAGKQIPAKTSRTMHPIKRISCRFMGGHRLFHR